MWQKAPRARHQYGRKNMALAVFPPPYRGAARRISMRGLLELAFDEDICDAMSFEALSHAYSRVLHDQDFPKRVANDMFCND